MKIFNEILETIENNYLLLYLLIIIVMLGIIRILNDFSCPSIKF